MAIVKRFKLRDTTIEIDDTYFPKSEEEKQAVYEEFNRIGWEILQDSEEEHYGRNKTKKK